MKTPARRGGPSLFAAAGLDRDAPRPLADKLRPAKLDEVVGADIVRRYGGRIYLAKLAPGHSTTDTIARIAG